MSNRIKGVRYEVRALVYRDILEMLSSSLMIYDLKFLYMDKTLNLNLMQHIDNIMMTKEKLMYFL